jgi:hypothetical protein
MLPITPDFEVLPSDRISESRAYGSLSFGSNWHPTSPKMNELKARHEATHMKGVNLALVERGHKV